MLLHYRTNKKGVSSNSWVRNVFAFFNLNQQKQINNGSGPSYQFGPGSTVNFQESLSDPEGFNPQIDNAASFLKQDKPDIAIVRLNELLTRHADKLTAREKYRIHANIGFAFGLEGKTEKSHAHHLKAAEFQPDEPKAIGVKALSLCCLLYTSPSPRDRQKSRMPSSA